MPGITSVADGITGKLPDILDKIFMFDAEETPVLSMIRKGSPPTAQILQEPADTPGYINARGVKDGTEAGGAVNQSEDYALLESNSHWVRGTASVGKKAQAIENRAGVGKKRLMARELVKSMKAWKTTADRIICDDTDQRDEGAVVGSETRGLGSWISSSAQTTRPVPEKFRTPAGSIDAATTWANLEESDVQDVVNSIYTKGGSVMDLRAPVGINLKQKVANWTVHDKDVSNHTAVRRFTQSGKDRTLCAVVDVLECEGGRLKLFKSRNLRWDRDFTKDTAQSTDSKQAMLIFADDAVKIRCAEDPTVEQLPNNGGGPRAQTTGILALLAQPTLCGKINPA